MTTIPIINLKNRANIISPKGSLVYDYNPLRVFKIDSPNMEYSDYTLDGWENKFQKGTYIILSNTGKYDTLVSDGSSLSILGEEVSIPYLKNNYLWKEEDGLAVFEKKSKKNGKGLIDNLDTPLLNFDITRPLTIDAQDSYDGTVNLIYNDNYSIPKLINTRFATIGDNKYQIVDREGEDDTNLYPQNSFESSIALQKITKGIVNIEFRGVNGNGNLPVGNYVFYFKLSDEDQNPTDFIGESSVVTCHNGNLLDPFSIEGGVEDQNSHKQVHFVLENIDSAYNRVLVYYTRTTSSSTGVLQVEHKMLGESYDVYNGSANITITGYEPTYAVDESEINTSYEIVGSAKAQAICNNRLFLGNIKKPEINNKALKNLALHFYPHIVCQSIGHVDNDYNISSGYEGIYRGEYYNTKNIYHYTGYWNDEIYRFGIVFIMKDGSLSQVFNIRGRCNVTSTEEESDSNKVKELKLYSNDKNKGQPNDPEVLDHIYEIPYDLDHYTINNEAYLEPVNNTTFTELENTKGVFNINSREPQLTSTDTYAYGIKISVDNSEVIKILQTFTKGYFIVRQKRLATTLCQAITIGTDRISHLPLLPVPQGYLTEGFLDSNRVLNNSFQSRTIIGTNAIQGSAAICPEYELRQNYFNPLFTSTNYSVQLALDQYENQTLDSSNNYFYPINTYVQSNKDFQGKVYIQAVPDSTTAIKNKSLVYSSKAGEAEEAKRFSYVFNRRKTEKNTSIARGVWGPYLGLESTRIGAIENLRRVNIKMPDYSSSNMEDLFHIRYQDSSPFYAVSDRKSFDEYKIDPEDPKKLDIVFRGDCYICNFTHRMVRNFQDPSFPVNDDILDAETWKTHYKLNKGGKSTNEKDSTITFKIGSDGTVSSVPNEDVDIAETAKINRGDVNAVKIGHWVTFKIMSNFNLSMRSVDETHIDEAALTHKGRTFYPLYPMSTEGTNKIPEAFIMNEGYGRTTSDQHRLLSKDLPTERTDFSTRIMYSELGVNNAISNNLRIFKSGNHRDYSTNYGQLVKLVPQNSYLVCIFEHGIGLIEINERAAINQASTEQVYIKSLSVLPEKMSMIHLDFGSQWPESVISTPTGIYGVDTVAKVIWRLDVGGGFETLSDFKVQNFLNNNITFSLHETSPIVGIRNVKTHYNAFKKDVIFTFYDDINTIEDKAWSLCYNEDTNVKTFTTFYSWLPSYSANIDNVFFTFDRQASKELAMLYDYQGKIKLSSDDVDYSYSDLHLFNKDAASIENSNICKAKITYTGALDYELAIDNKYISDEIFKLKKEDGYYTLTLYDKGLNSEVYHIPIIISEYQTDNNGQRMILRKLNTTLMICTEQYRTKLQNYIWKHGQAGLMQLDTEIKPTNWYGKQHPFEFEFVVNKDIYSHKVFENLIILSNKTKPESLHFEVVGEVYNFAKDKLNMFYRQEATKQLYQYYGYDIAYNKEYLKLNPEHRWDKYSEYFDKSIIFPLRVTRQDSLNEIYDYYQRATSNSLDYQSLSGAEITYDKLLNDFNVNVHIPVYPLDGYEEVKITADQYEYYKRKNVQVRKEGNDYYKLVPYGRRLGNAEYESDRWLIQIPSINYVEKNEEEWTNNVPPLNVYYNPLPEDGPINGYIDKPEQTNPFPDKDIFINNNGISLYKYDNINQIKSDNWGNYKQTRLRDKYMKIKVRYDGEDLAVIAAIITLFQKST